MNSISTSTINEYSIKNCREENKWIAIYTKARHEKQVQRQLELMGIEAYVPLKKEYHRWSDRVKLVDVPLIPSYVFVCPNPTQYLKMFTVNGIEATKNIIAEYPDARIVIVTDYGNKEFRTAAANAGAVDYVLKENLIKLRKLCIDKEKDNLI